MSIEHIQAGIRLAEQIEADNQTQLAKLQSGNTSVYGYNGAINRIITKYALLGYDITRDKVLSEEFPDLEELKAFSKFEHGIAAVSVALGGVYDASPDVFVPLIVTRIASKTWELATDMVVADSRPQALLYDDYFTGENKPSDTIDIDGESFNVAQAMDGYTYKELCNYARGGAGDTRIPNFDQGAYTVLTAYPPNDWGSVFAMASSGRTISGLSGGQRLRFRPAVTLPRPM